MTDIKDASEFRLRQPQSTDGSQIFQLVAKCPPLDPNSLYCNLLQCTHFAATSVIAELNGGKQPPEVVGFISGHLIPDRPDTLFIWQVAVSERARGAGLATRMLDEILSRSACADVSWLETTITPDNIASMKLFERFACRHKTEISKSLMFDKHEHFMGAHESEFLFRVGPFALGSD